MPGTERQSAEALEGLLKRFRRELSQSGQLQQYRRKQRYASKSEIRREKIRKALRRLRRKERRAQKRSAQRYGNE